MSKTPIGQEHYEDVLVVTITPRHADRTVDIEGVKRNAIYLADRGVKIIMPQCGTGLVYDSSLEDYRITVEAVMEAVGDRTYVIPGVGPGFGRSQEMGSVAKEVGVDSVMIMPVVGPASPDGVFTGIRDLVESLDLPVVLYLKDARLMPLASTIRLARLPQVHAIKYAVTDYEMFDRLVDDVGDEVVLLCGMAEKPAVAFMDRGAKGYSSGMANFVPKLSLALHRAHRSNDADEVARIHALMVPFEDIRGEEKGKYNAAALHVANEHIGLAGGPVLPMCTDVAPTDIGRVRALTDHLMQAEAAL
jgi:dihydrodipicolinate synthase/N-acetylneuraminate lyase